MEGPELPVIQTERLGFKALAGDAKVQLTPKWPQPPAPTASLLAIASRRAIVAAAGPDGIYLSRTGHVRSAFERPKNGDSEVRPYEAQAKIPSTMRVSHLAFTPDEQYLILAAQQGGVLAVYETQPLDDKLPNEHAVHETQVLIQGNALFEIATNGESIMTLVPNPTPELGEFCAVVTTNGNLLMATLKERSLVSGSNGPVLRAGVTSVGWSTRGKQLVAGLADGSLIQMTPDGAEKAAIPKPNSLGNFQVASVSWLENHVFLVIYNDVSDVGTSKYFVITRSAAAKQAPSFEYRRLQEDPVAPFGNELPPHHTILRLRDYPPAIQELLIVTSSVSDSLGLLTKAKTPLDTNGLPAEQVTNVFTTTEFTDDSRRAQLPTDEEFNGTTPVGVALDLSSRDSVSKPIADDEEIVSSLGPLPGAWTLNNQGVLTGWWLVYYDAVRQGQNYPGFAAVQGESVAQHAASTTNNSALPATTAFGTQPSKPPFGSSSAFGNPSPAPSNPFGGPVAASPAPAFGTPSFGSTSNLGAKPSPTAFGQHGMLGTKVSPWSTGTAGASPAFGSHGFSSPAAPSTGTSGKVFGAGAASTVATTGTGFAGLAGQSGFAGLGSNKSGDSIFSKPASSSPFGAAPGGQSAFGSQEPKPSVFGNSSGNSPFGMQQTPTNSGSVFSAPDTTAKQGSAFGGSPFVLGTTFKADPATAHDNEKPTGRGGFSLGAFGVSLDAANSPQVESRDENMELETPVAQEKTKSIFDLPQGTKPATSTVLSPGAANPFDRPATTSSLFGSIKPQADAPKPNPFASAGPPKVNPFEQASSTTKASPSPFGSLFGGGGDKSSLPKSSAADAVVDPPLPPDATSKAVYPFGESSSSSVASAKTTEDYKKSSEPVEDAPLPPDFVSSKSKKSESERAPPPLPRDDSPEREEAPLPPDSTKPKIESKSSFFSSLPAPSIPESSNDELSEDLDSDDERAQHESDEDGEHDDEDPEEGSEDDDEQEGGSEGSGIDVAKDLSPNSAGAGNTPGQTPQSSFGGMGSSSFSIVPRPGGAQPPRSSIFGGAAPILNKPAPASPRSPSPVRSSFPSRMFPGSQSVSASGGATRPQNSVYSKSVSSRIPSKEDPNVVLQREAQKKQVEQEEQSLEDDEYEQVQADLERPIEPTLDVGEFNAYISVTADAHASTIAAQVEALYRDMNGMLLTLGMNARALSAFIKGHEELRSSGTKTKDDLNNADDWVLCEAEDLDRILEDELAPELEDARVQDVQDTWDTCQDLVRGLPQLRAKQKDLKQILGSVLDPDRADDIRQMPLSAEQSTQRNALRHGYARVTKLMADAESALTMLKTKLASLSGTPSAQPTVEAIMRTIARMTSAAEKRSGEIDIIESQMRKLRLTGSVTPSTNREETPEALRTPTPNKRNSLSRTLSGGSTFSPSPMRSMDGSASRSGPSPRKKLTGFTADDKDAIRKKMEKRQAVLDRLRGKLVENGPKVSRMGDTR